MSTNYLYLYISTNLYIYILTNYLFFGLRCTGCEICNLPLNPKILDYTKQNHKFIFYHLNYFFQIRLEQFKLGCWIHYIDKHFYI